jgi:uncharacterized protein (DUF2345 family)
LSGDTTQGQGAAYVFVKPKGGWASMTETAKLTASDGAIVDAFGSVVFIDGDTIVIGAAGKTIGGKTAQGAAYVFVKPAGGWTTMTETARLTVSDGEMLDSFGSSVSMSGDVVVIGARGGKVGSNTSQGTAYVFVRPRSGWTTMTESARLTASDGSALDAFGASVSMSGDTVVVGAIDKKSGGNASQGAVYVFVRPRSGWATMTETAKLTASDGSTQDEFGSPVRISNDTIGVGALNKTIRGNANQGAVYVFDKPRGGWVNMTETAKLTASDGSIHDRFGGPLSIGGNSIVAGAAGKSIVGNVSLGSVYVFVRPDSGWATMTETSKLPAPDWAIIEPFGTALSLSGDTLAVGTSSKKIGGNNVPSVVYVFPNSSFR